MLLRKIDRRRLLTGGTALTLASLAGPLSSEAASAGLYYEPRESATVAKYTRVELESYVNRYLEALIAHDPKRAS